MSEAKIRAIVATKQNQVVVALKRKARLEREIKSLSPLVPSLRLVAEQGSEAAQRALQVYDRHKTIVEVTSKVLKKLKCELTDDQWDEAEASYWLEVTSGARVR